MDWCLFWLRICGLLLVENGQKDLDSLLPASASLSWTKPTTTGSHLDILVLIGWAILQAEHQCYISPDSWSRTQCQSGRTMVRIHLCISGSEIPEIISLVMQTRWWLRWLVMTVQHDCTAETFSDWSYLFKAKPDVVFSNLAVVTDT